MSARPEIMSNAAQDYRENEFLYGYVTIDVEIVPPERFDDVVSVELAGLKADLKREYKRMRLERGLSV